MKDEEAIDWKEGFSQTFIGQIEQVKGKGHGKILVFWKILSYFFGKRRKT